MNPSVAILLVIMHITWNAKFHVIYNSSQWQQNGISVTSKTHRTIMEDYYRPSPKEFYGYATRSGSDEQSRNILKWELAHLREQIKAGYPLIGKAYGYHTMFDGQNILIDNDTTLNNYLESIPLDPTLNEQQKRMMSIPLDKKLFDKYITDNYVGIISIKSPNDIGRIYCLYDATSEPVLIGKVIVGDVAMGNDFTPYGKQTNKIALGYRTVVDHYKTVVHWAADLPDKLFYKIMNGNSAFILLRESTEYSMCE